MSNTDHSDLRGAAMDQKRDRTSQHKWCPRFTQHRQPTRYEDHRQDRLRPLIPGKHTKSMQAMKKSDAKLHAKNSAARLPALPAADPDYRPDVASESDAWTDDSVPDEACATGERVLEDAIKRAEHTYEDKQTTRLVKDEYDVVDDAANDDGPSSQAVEDEFEML